MDKTTRHKAALALLAFSMAIPISAARLTPIVNVTMPDGYPAKTIVFEPETDKNYTTRAEESTARLTVSVMTDNGRNQTVENVLAVSTDAQNPRMYEAEKSGSVYIVDVEHGVYDVVVFIKSDNEDTQIFLFEEGVEIAAPKRILLNQRNATISTSIGRTTPTGSEFKMLETGDRGNCSLADHLMILRHKDFGTLLQDETGAFRNVCRHVAVNLIPERLTLSRMDVYAWNEGPAFMVVPIDFSKEVNGPSEGEWHEVSASIAPTPMSTAWKALQEPPVFSMTGYFIASGKHCNAYVGIGNYNHEFPTDRLYYWAPEGYDGFFEFYPMLRDNVMVMADASVSSMPYRMTAAGLVPSGLNLAGSSVLLLDDGFIPAEGHPSFSDPLPEGAQLGNSVPALVCIPNTGTGSGWNRGFQYDFTGRYGEQLGIDSYNYTGAIEAGDIERIGGYRRTLKVTRDGQEICSSPADFMINGHDWGRGEIYAMELEMNNVLIDGEIEGRNTSTLTYKASDFYIPTLTSLRFCDNGIVTDRFDVCDNATLELTAASFAYSGLRKLTFKAPSLVKAEYAPHGSTEFTEIKLTEVPEKFYLPGYGTFFTASLSKTERKSDDKWYDLRVTVEGADGSAQIQTLSPAFRLETPADPSSVEEVIAESVYDVYSIDGRVIARGVSNSATLSLEGGLYIVVEGGTTRKLLID